MTVSKEFERTWKNVVVGSVIGSPVSNSKANNTKSEIACKCCEKVKQQLGKTMLELIIKLLLEEGSLKHSGCES